MLSLIILFLGTFWESSMDVIGNKQNYERSFWRQLAEYFDGKGIKRWGSAFWMQEQAWKNKWKNKNPKNGAAFPGSTHMFVTFMDGWHVVKFCWLMHLFAVIVCYTPVTSSKALDVLVFYLTFGAGHQLFFSNLQKCRKYKLKALKTDPLEKAVFTEN